MAKLLKLVEKMLRLPSELRYEEVIKVLEAFDWQFINTDGSHFIYAKGDVQITVVRHHNKVKRGYIREIIEILNLEEWYEQNKK